MVEYFLTANEVFLRGMGVDPDRLPRREAWLERLLPRYRATPGLIAFEQEVNRYVMDRLALGDLGA